jgi:hypothetical protein
MSSGWHLEKATMTMESKSRENQQIACETEDASGRTARDVMVDAGIAVHQKSYAAERESRGKSGEDGQIC